jgi:cytochrome c peroxidase
MAHGGVWHPDLASSFRIKRKMTLIALPGLVRALCFLAAAAAELVFCTDADSAPATPPKTIEQEIAAIQAEIDAIEAAAIAGIPSLLPGSPQRLPALGKMLFYDQELSVNRNEACAFCHMPQTGYQGAIESLNLGSIAMPGSVRTRFSFRKPPSAAYAAFSPPILLQIRCFSGRQDRAHGDGTSRLRSVQRPGQMHKLSRG